MRKISIILLALSLVAVTEAKTLVAYFSATGTTKAAAEQIAAELKKNGQEVTVWAIEPAEPYTAADLDWRNKNSRSTIEMQDPESRPSIKDCNNVQPYDIVYVGYPIWWGICPRIINSWLDNNVAQLEGKKLYPFATSGSSTIEQSVEYLKKTYPTLDWQIGRLVR